jgi:hypothetical protein
MGTDIAWFQMQLALVQWHLDAALSAALEAVRHHHREKAREAYVQAIAVLPSAKLNPDQREEVARRIAALHLRLGPLADGP